MSDQLRDIMMSGFIIYPSNGKFIVKKEAVPESNYNLAEYECDSYGEAIDYAIEMLKKPILYKWSAMVRYNRGLGVEYKKLNEIESETYDLAMQIAVGEVELIFKKQKVTISEIKVRLKKPMDE